MHITIVALLHPCSWSVKAHDLVLFTGLHRWHLSVVCIYACHMLWFLFCVFAVTNITKVSVFAALCVSSVVCLYALQLCVACVRQSLLLYAFLGLLAGWLPACLHTSLCHVLVLLLLPACCVCVLLRFHQIHGCFLGYQPLQLWLQLWKLLQDILTYVTLYWGFG